jgi:hypothetical protein
MNRTYVESLPEGNVHILPDQVFIITDKLEEEVTDESGTYIRKSYVIVDVLTPEAYSIMQAEIVRSQGEDIEGLKDAVLEVADLVLGGI